MSGPSTAPPWCAAAAGARRARFGCAYAPHSAHHRELAPQVGARLAQPAAADEALLPLRAALSLHLPLRCDADEPAPAHAAAEAEAAAQKAKLGRRVYSARPAVCQVQGCGQGLSADVHAYCFRCARPAAFAHCHRSRSRPRTTWPTPPQTAYARCTCAQRRCWSRAAAAAASARCAPHRLRSHSEMGGVAQSVAVPPGKRAAAADAQASVRHTRMRMPCNTVTRSSIYRVSLHVLARATARAGRHWRAHRRAQPVALHCSLGGAWHAVATHPEARPVAACLAQRPKHVHAARARASEGARRNGDTHK